MLKPANVAGSIKEKEAEVAVFPGGIMTINTYNLLLHFAIFSNFWYTITI